MSYGPPAVVSRLLNRVQLRNRPNGQDVPRLRRVLDARDMAGVHKMRAQVFALERRVVLAFGADTEHLERSKEGSS